MTQHRKYNRIQSSLEEALTALMPQLDITSPDDKIIYDHMCNAIEHAASVASAERGVYESND